MATNPGQSFVVPWRLPSAPEGYDYENEQKFRRILELALMKQAGVQQDDDDGGTFDLRRKGIRIQVPVPSGVGEGTFSLEGGDQTEAGADLLQIGSSTPVRVLLYATAKDLEDDRARNELTLPVTPCILEAILGEDVENRTRRLFDLGVEGVHAFNRDDPAVKTIYYRVVLPAVNYIAEGFAVNTFPGTAGLVLDDDGRKASLYGFRYTPAASPNPYGRAAPWLGGWDNYYVRGADGSWSNGLRARGNATLGIARLFELPPSTIQWQTTNIKHDSAINDSPSYGVQHSYFVDNLNKRNTLQIGFTRSAFQTVLASIGWYDSSGTYATLATGTTYSIATAKRLTTAVVGNEARLYVAGALVLTASVPTALRALKTRGLGLLMSAAIVPGATRTHGAAVVLDYGVKSANASLFLDLGYVPCEEPGGTIVPPGTE